MIVTYMVSESNRLETMEFLEILKNDGYKIEWAWSDEEYSKEYFINKCPQYSPNLVVDHEKKTACFWETIIGVNCLVCDEVPRENPYTRK